jgi:hypothetical protein
MLGARPHADHHSRLALKDHFEFVVEEIEQRFLDRPEVEATVR